MIFDFFLVREHIIFRHKLLSNWNSTLLIFLVSPHLQQSLNFISDLKLLFKSHLNDNPNIEIYLHLIKFIFNFSHYLGVILLIVFHNEDCCSLFLGLFNFKITFLDIYLGAVFVCDGNFTVEGATALTALSLRSERFLFFSTEGTESF